MRTTRLARVTTFLRPQRFPLLVSNGRVACPMSTFDVEVDRCLGCDLYEGTVGADNGTWVQCRGTRARPGSDPVGW
jgi:hypothetical protein